MSKQDRATIERNSRTLRELVKGSENKLCADCKRNDPRWASWNLGVFLCIRCSGIHRGMGTHISKVKSVDLDVWTPEQMAAIQKWGNKRANLYWEAHLKQGHVPPEHKIESFIRSKYESRRWAMEGAPPADPAVLEGASSSQSEQQTPVPVAEAVAAAPKTQTPPPAIASGSSSRVRQPQHQLLSSAYTSRNQHAQPIPAATGAPAAPAPQVPASATQDLFSLDFHTPSPSSTPAAGPSASAQPKKDAKQDILALFSSGTPATTPATASFGSFNPPIWGQSQAAAAPLQSAQLTSMIGNTGAGAWGTNSGWGTQPLSAQPAASNLWGSVTAAPAIPAQQSNLFNTSNVWNSNAAAAPSQDLFGGFGLADAPPKKDDAFGDIWGGFK